MIFFTVVSVLFALCAVNSSIEKPDKRILLNDPDVLQHRVDLLESKLLELSRKFEAHQEANGGQTTYVRWGRKNCNENSTLVYSGQTTYAHWGRKNCNGNSTLVYSGQLGGTRYDTTGGAANPLCLALDVIWGSRASEAKGIMAEIEGAEYQDHFWGPGSLDKEVPCAVCKPNKRSSVLMIPGRNECLPGWFKEYYGYLSANLKMHAHTSTYICVDENVEYLDGGAENNEGYLLFGVRARCGSLKCPPYENGKPITCVVCSQ